MKSFYATSLFHVAHTGGGIGEIWHNASMCQMADRRPVQYRSFLDERRWVMELSRQHDGSIGIGGIKDGYDSTATDKTKRTWGTYFALTYTLPRKTLQLSGAPRTQWCKSYTLPERPWGNAADDMFVDTEPAEHPSITMEALLQEKIPTDAVWPVLRRIEDPDVTDETLLKYLHHPEYGYRVGAMRTVVNQGRDHLILPLMKSNDPRVRHVALLAITGTFGADQLPAERLTPEMFELAGRMVEDPNESLWVVQSAMRALGRADKQIIARHLDQLLAFLKFDDWMIRKAAMEALIPLATDPSHYRVVLPRIILPLGEATTLQALSPGWMLSRQLWSVDPKVNALAVAALKRAYSDVPGDMIAPGGHVINAGAETVRKQVEGWASDLKGGKDLAYTAPKTTSSWMKTGRRADRYVYYPGRFEPNRAAVGAWRQVASVSSAQEVVAELKALSAPAPENPKKHARRKKPTKKGLLQLNDGGTVGESTKSFWSGNMLVDIPKNEARKIRTHSLGGKKFLIVEQGGFSKKHASGERKLGYVLYERAK